MTTQLWTSETHPIYVDWLPVSWPGKMGLTLAPGKRGDSVFGGTWDRDVARDLDRLRNELSIDVLVCLLREHEFARLGIPTLASEARARGIEFWTLPIEDGGVPRASESREVGALVEQIAAAAKRGMNVVIHCRGGLGRSGLLAGCVLVAAGIGADDALRMLRECRGPNCPETHEQREFIRAFAARTER